MMPPPPDLAKAWGEAGVLNQRLSRALVERDEARAELSACHAMLDDGLLAAVRRFVWAYEHACRVPLCFYYDPTSATFADPDAINVERHASYAAMVKLVAPEVDV